MTSGLNNYIKRERLMNGGTNTLFNGGIAWLSLKGKGLLHLAGSGSFAIDIVATAFILPFIVTLIVIPLQKRKANKGSIARFTPNKANLIERLAAGFPQSLWLSALYFGLIGMLIIAPTTLLGIILLGADTFTPEAYSLFKGLWAGAIAAILVGPMIMVGLRDTHE